MDFLLLLVWPYLAAAAGLGLVAGIIGEILSARGQQAGRTKGHRR